MQFGACAKHLLVLLCLFLNSVFERQPWRTGGAEALYWEYNAGLEQCGRNTVTGTAASQGVCEQEAGVTSGSRY